MQKLIMAYLADPTDQNAIKIQNHLSKRPMALSLIFVDQTELIQKIMKQAQKAQK